VVHLYYIRKSITETIGSLAWFSAPENFMYLFTWDREKGMWQSLIDLPPKEGR